MESETNRSTEAIKTKAFKASNKQENIQIKVQPNFSQGNKSVFWREMDGRQSLRGINGFYSQLFKRRRHTQLNKGAEILFQSLQRQRTELTETQQCPLLVGRHGIRFMVAV